MGMAGTATRHGIWPKAWQIAKWKTHHGKSDAQNYSPDDIKKMEERIRQLKSEVEKAYCDTVTGICNRRYYDENIGDIINSLSRSGGALSLMMADIDCFKLYNDTYGHDKGDRCLRKVAEAISKSVTRSGDFVARYGGEEFVIVLPNTDEVGARLLASKILDSVRDLNVPHCNNSASDCVTISIGVTTGIVNYKMPGEDFIRQADRMLYASKQNGRNRYTFSPIKDSSQFPLTDEGIALIESANRALDVTERRSAMVGALNSAISIFYEHGEKSFAEILSNGLRSIAEVMRADRVVVYRRMKMDETQRFKQLYLWDKKEGVLGSGSYEYLPDAKVMHKWDDICLHHNCINLRWSDMTEEERDYLSLFGTKSILIVPAFTHGFFWGVVVFQDRANERRFDEDCLDLIQSGALISVTAIVRHEMAQREAEALKEANRLKDALERRETILDALNKMAITLLTHENDGFADVMSRSIKPFAQALNLNRVAVYRCLSDSNKVGQTYLWMHGDTVGLDEKLLVLPDDPPVVRWLDALKKGECIHNRVSDVAEDQAEFLGLFGIKSILFVPIFTHAHFWGVITMENLTDDRYFDEDCIELMRSAAHMCAGAVVRAETEREVERIRTKSGNSI